jgi:class 3 adenylate cyclase
MEQPQIRYTKTSDGVSIAYFAIGSGRTLVYMPPAPWTHIELEWKVDDLRRGAEAVAQVGRYVRYDGRGFGLSDRSAHDFSLEAMVRDLEAVIDAVEPGPFALMATQFMAMPALVYAAKRPDRVSALVLWLGVARGRDLGGRLPALMELARNDWEAFKELGAHSLGFTNTSAHQAMRRVADEAATQEAWLEFIEAARGWDVSALLPDIQTPALVMGRREFRDVPIQAVRDLAASLPNAQLVTLEGSALAATTPDVGAAIAAFVSRIASSGAPEPARGAAPAGGTRTVLFTDLVGHTEMMRRLGDERGREVLREHERITRELLKQHGGHEIKTDGDSFMISFGSVTSAVDCAIALQRALAARNEGADEALHVRIGLNAGEPIEEEGDLFGSSVIMASRIAAQADAGEILIAEPVRHLLAGKSYVYADRGETMLKGFEDAVRLYEVRWSNA